MSLPCCSESLHVDVGWVAGWDLLCFEIPIPVWFTSHSPFSSGHYWPKGFGFPRGMACLCFFPTLVDIISPGPPERHRSSLCPGT